jgi:hypothetical protein
MPEHAQDFSSLSGDFRNPQPGKSARQTIKGKNIEMIYQRSPN